MFDGDEEKRFWDIVGFLEIKNKSGGCNCGRENCPIDQVLWFINQYGVPKEEVAELLHRFWFVAPEQKFLALAN